MNESIEKTLDENIFFKFYKKKYISRTFQQFCFKIICQESRKCNSGLYVDKIILFRQIITMYYYTTGSRRVQVLISPLEPNLDLPYAEKIVEYDFDNYRPCYV